MQERPKHTTRKTKPAKALKVVTRNVTTSLKHPHDLLADIANFLHVLARSPISSLTQLELDPGDNSYFSCCLIW